MLYSGLTLYLPLNLNKRNVLKVYIIMLYSGLTLYLLSLSASSVSLLFLSLFPALMDSPPSSPLLGGGGGGGRGEGVIAADEGGKEEEEEEKEGEEKKEAKEREGEGERTESKKPAQKVAFSGVRQDDSGSETEAEEEREEEGEGEGKGKGEEEREKQDFEYEDTVPYPMDDPCLHDDDGGSSEGAGPFDGHHDNKNDESTLPYDIENENNKQESKQQDGSGKQETQTSKTGSADEREQGATDDVDGVAPSNDQTLSYEVDTETDGESDTEVRSKVESAAPRNLATDESHTADIPSTSSITQSHREMLALRNTEDKNASSPVIKSDDESRDESELEEQPVPVTTTTEFVTRGTRSKQKTLVIEMVRGGRRGRGRGRGRGRTTPAVRHASVDTDSTEEKVEAAATEAAKGKRGRERGRGKKATPLLQTVDTIINESVEESVRERGRRRKGKREGERRAEFLLESSEEQTTSDPASGADSAVEEKDDKNLSSTTLPPPTSAVSVVRRIVEGMTLKSEESRFPVTDVAPATVAMETVESLGDGGVDGHVTQAEGSCDPKLSPPTSSHGSTCDVRDNQSDRESVTSSGTPSVEGRERGRGRGKGRVKKPATPRATNTPKLQTRGNTEVYLTPPEPLKK